MIKTKRYPETRFTVEALKEAIGVTREVAAREKIDPYDMSLCVEHDDSSWDYDTLEEFFADFRKYQGYALLRISYLTIQLQVMFHGRNVEVHMRAPLRLDIEGVFDVFEKNSMGSKLPPLPLPPPVSPVVFIGHGRSLAWRDIKDHLHEKHKIKIEAYECGARAGHAIRDVLKEMMTKSSFAILVLTGEDEQSDGLMRARQNVIHEAGIFQGRLGFARAILLLEEGVEEFSNVQGVQSIRFSKNNIKETFGEVLATLRREFQD